MKPVNSRDNNVIEAGRMFLSNLARGGIVRGETIRNEAPKIKPNEPCHCGSGKKHKKCCGAAVLAPELTLPGAPESIPPNMD